MKSHEEEIETQIGCRKTYIPPLVSFDALEKGCILAGSIKNTGQDTDPDDNSDSDPVRGINVQSICIDPIEVEDYSLGIDNY